MIVKYMKAGMRVANLISFSCTSCRLELNAFASSVSSLGPRDVEDAARVDPRHVRADVGQHRQERHEIPDGVLRVQLGRRQADPVFG